MRKKEEGAMHLVRNLFKADNYSLEFTNPRIAIKTGHKGLPVQGIMPDGKRLPR